MSKIPCVYILALGRNGTLYIGVTSELFERLSVHRQDLIDRLTKTYGVHRLVYCEMHETMGRGHSAREAAQEVNRAWKLRLIESMNPEWEDLFDVVGGGIHSGPVDRARAKP